MTLPQRPAFRVVLALMGALAVLAVAPAGATAQSGKGVTEIDLGGKGFNSLRNQGVTVAARRPARISKGVLRLPVTKGLVTSSAYLNHGGQLRLRRKAGKRTRTFRLSQLQARLGKDSSIIGTVGKRRYAVFSVTAAPKRLSLNAGVGSASLREARVSLTRKAARAIKSSLKLERLPTGAFGDVTVDALVGGTGTGSGDGGGGGGGSAPGGGDGTPQSGPISNEPPLLARPVTAVDVANPALTWSPRDSWLSYVATGEGTTASDGAAPVAETTSSPCPDAPKGTKLPYSYTFAPKSGWYDPVSGYAGLYFTGRVHFGFSAHTIDLATSSPEIEITADSRAIYRFKGAGGTAYPDQRAAFLSLAAAPQPGHASGQTVTYTNAKGTLTKDGESVFAGFYPGPSNNGFGCVTVSFTIP